MILIGWKKEELYIPVIFIGWKKEELYIPVILIGWKKEELYIPVIYFFTQVPMATTLPCLPTPTWGQGARVYPYLFIAPQWMATPPIYRCPRDASLSGPHSTEWTKAEVGFTQLWTATFDFQFKSIAYVLYFRYIKSHPLIERSINVIF